MSEATVTELASIRAATKPAEAQPPELVWFAYGGWHLCHPDRVHIFRVTYSAWGSPLAAVAYKVQGAAKDRRDESLPDEPARVRQIAIWARDDGYHVPPHPRGLDIEEAPRA